jgi:hypothetical protein
MNNGRPLLALLALTAMMASFCTVASAATCGSLASLKLPNTTVTAAKTVAAGAFVSPSGGLP